MSDLYKIVQLFRTSTQVDFDGACITGTVGYSALVDTILKNIMEEFFSAGRLSELELDNINIDHADDYPNSWATCRYTFIINQGDASKFYLDCNDFIQANCLSKGCFPEEYFIVEDNFYSQEEKKPTFILQLENILTLICSLAKIAHYHDIKHEGGNSFYRLVFVMDSESKSTSAVLETSIQADILNVNNIQSQLINSLVAINPLTDAHYEEKINTFRNTLIEYIINHKPSFTNLVSNLESINKLYSNNLAVYMSAFSFHKARKEIADAEIDFAEKISKTLLDLSNKVLAIPISLVGSIALFKLIETGEIIVAFIGIVLTSIIMHLVIISQQKQFERVIHAKEIVFTSLLKKIDSEDEELLKNSDLETRISEAKAHLKDNESFCKKVLYFLLSASWVPTSIGTLVVLYKLLVKV